MGKSRAGWSKEPKRENNSGLFRNVFYACIRGKSGICLLLAMSIGNDCMVNLMILYIGKTIAKALDIYDIIKNNHEDVSSMSQNLSINNQI